MISRSVIKNTRKMMCALWVLFLCIQTLPTHATLATDTTTANSGPWTCLLKYLHRHDIPITSNNSVVLLENGQKKFDDLFAAIRKARHSIHLEYFNFRNDSIAGQLFELLAERAAAGVQVRAIFDAFGNNSNNKPLTATHLRALRSRGIQIYTFDPIRFPWVNHVWSRDHRKIVVIDGLIAYTGGMNVADYYIHGKPSIGEWRDLHMRVSGAVVGQLQRIFVNLWHQVTGEQLQGTEYYPGEKIGEDFFPTLTRDTTASARHKVIAVINREPHTSPRIIRETFLEAIRCAQHKIQIVNPYFTLNRALKHALVQAVKRGVDVQIMVSSRSDISITPDIVDYVVHKLMRKGIKVYYYQGGFHHSKVMMIDDNITFAGSANLNSRSLRYDYECNLLIFDHATTYQLQEIYERDKRIRCFRLTEEAWRQRPFVKRMSGWFFHFLSPFVYQPLIYPSLPSIATVSDWYKNPQT